MKELREFFELEWIYNPPNVFILPDRKTINSLKNMETNDWLVGWSDGNNVYMLSAENFEKESNNHHIYTE